MKTYQIKFALYIEYKENQIYSFTVQAFTEAEAIKKAQIAYLKHLQFLTGSFTIDEYGKIH